MFNTKWNKRVTVASLVLNIILLSGAGYLFIQKGGLAYAISKLTHADTSTKAFSNQYYQEVSIFDELTKKNSQIVFLGDSLIAHAQWSELLSNTQVVNRGIPGDTTDGVLNRLNQVTQTHPKKVFLMIGINDIYSKKDTSTIVTNYKKIIDTINKDSPETNIYIASVLPVNKAKYTAADAIKMNQSVIALNEELKKLQTPYIDLCSVLSENGELKAAHTYDGLHLNGVAYTLWKKEIEKYLD